jgi:hypothetical protein
MAPVVGVIAVVVTERVTIDSSEALYSRRAYPISNSFFCCVKAARLRLFQQITGQSVRRTPTVPQE